MKHIEQVNIALKYGKFCKELNCSLAKSSSFLTPYDKIKQDLTNLFYADITKYINTVIFISMYFPPFLTDEEKSIFRQFLYDYIDLIDFKNLNKNSEAYLNFCKLIADRQTILTDEYLFKILDDQVENPKIKDSSELRFIILKIIRNI